MHGFITLFSELNTEEIHKRPDKASRLCLAMLKGEKKKWIMQKDQMASLKTILAGKVKF